MIVKKEISSLNDFDAWSGGNDTKEDIIKAGKEEEAWQFIEEVFEGEADYGDINDFLWFERDEIYSRLGMDMDGNLIEDEDEDEEIEESVSEKQSSEKDIIKESLSGDELGKLADHILYDIAHYGRLEGDGEIKSIYDIRSIKQWIDIFDHLVDVKKTINYDEVLKDLVEAVFATDEMEGGTLIAHIYDYSGKLASSIVDQTFFCDEDSTVDEILDVLKEKGMNQKRYFKSSYMDYYSDKGIVEYFKEYCPDRYMKYLDWLEIKVENE